MTSPARRPRTYGTCTRFFADEDGDHDFGIMGDVDLDATQDGGEVIFKNYRVGFIEDLLED